MSKKKRRKPESTESEGFEPELLLDQFTHNDLRRWQKNSQVFNRFQRLYFFSLDAQRATHEKEIREALLDVESRTIDINGWRRAVRYRWSVEPLSSRGSVLDIGGRFNIGSAIDKTRFPAFNALYIAEDQETALREFFQIADANGSGLTREEFALCPPDSLAIVALTGQVYNVFDLTQPANLEGFVAIIRRFKLDKEVKAMAMQLGIKRLSLARSVPAVLTLFFQRNWRLSPNLYGLPSNPQIFGRLLYLAGYEGVLYHSAKGAGRCLCVYPRNLGQSRICLADQPPEPTTCPELNRDTRKQLL